MHIDLSHRNAVICGASKGIGKAIALALSASGANVILLARNEDLLKETLHLLTKKKHQKHHFLVTDFKNPESVIHELEKINAKPHILINNTGGPPAGPGIDATIESFEDAFKTHLYTSHLLTKYAVPFMKSEKFGRIINIISTSVKIPIEGLGVSNTVRGAMASWSKTISNEIAQYGITVNNILPGFTDTDRLNELIKSRAQTANVTENEIIEKMTKSVPAKRFGAPEETASLAVFLTSEFASYINGTNIPVDGGKTGSI